MRRHERPEGKERMEVKIWFGDRTLDNCNLKRRTRPSCFNCFPLELEVCISKVVQTLYRPHYKGQFDALKITQYQTTGGVLVYYSRPIVCLQLLLITGSSHCAHSGRHYNDRHYEYYNS